MSLITRFASMAVVAVAILCIWFIATAVIFRLTEQAPGALVLFPGRYLQAENLPQGVTILKWSEEFAVLGSGDAGYVARLYAAGVPIVFPARSNGCMSYRN
ncbi:MULTISPECIES: hypothetical protein [unclassified Rhizobium]|uniref:hypothetical protein n=1 Tax=unclassified Rhizobium TaxID=2613769 RepID=UPI0012E2F947|nr:MULTISPECIES: hypothetical protein [unclassified Rhizobium]